MLEQHPFINQEYANGFYSLPPQTVPLKDKISKDGKVTLWGKVCMDTFSNIAKAEYNSKKKYAINYKLLNGEFVASEYINDCEEENTFNLIDELNKDLQVPSTVKHYDIISQPIYTLIGELSELPDILSVEGKGDKFESDKLRIKKDMILDYFKTEVTKKVLANLLEKGIDINNPETLQNEQQAEEIKKQIKELEVKLTPPEIENYFKTNTYRHLIEMWAEIELQDQLHRFNIKKCQRIEFTDYLAIGERFRFIYKNAQGLQVESLNPRFVFSHKSPNIDYIQDGDYAGFTEFLSINSVIDKYGYLMNKTQIESLQKPWLNYKEIYANKKLGKSLFNEPINYLHPTGLPYQTNLWSKDFNQNMYMPWLDSFNNYSQIGIDKIDLQNTGSEYQTEMLLVTNAFWKSQKKLGKLYWKNPNTGIDEKILVDETFVLPKYIKEVEGSVLFNETDLLNTITWTYINEGWKGIKIENYSGSFLKEPIYLDIKPNELQFKGELFIYGSKLPIAGQFANNRNSTISSAVDKVKNLQFFYDILMNQCFHFFQTELLPFVLMDTGIMPKDKDWGGEDKLEKWVELAQRLGVTVADTSPLNSQGANVGGQLPKVIDLDRGARVLSRLRVAQEIRQLALQQLGISDQRLGQINANETASGVNQAISRSYTQTSTWFESFFDCEREILQMQLDAAQYLQSKNLDLSNVYINSSYTESLLKISGSDFNLYNLHIYVLKSQEEKRKLQYAQKLAEMNTTPTPMSERILMGTSSDIKDIISKLKITEEEAIKQQQQQIQLQEQQINQQKEFSEKQLQKQDEQFYAKLQNELDKATINAYGDSKEASIDNNNNDMSDMLEVYNSRIKQYQALNEVKQNDFQNVLNQQKINIESQKINSSNLEKDKQRNHEQLLADKKVAQAKIQGDKSK